MRSSEEFQFTDEILEIRKVVLFVFEVREGLVGLFDNFVRWVIHIWIWICSVWQWLLWVNSAAQWSLSTR